jgi:hypothetical protein
MKDQPPEQEQRRYISYLLRLWQAGSKQELVWRASLESAYTGERRGFANLTELFAFLEKEVSRVDQRRIARNRDEEGGDADR